MSRTRAAREGRYNPGVHGDYDGASGIPSLFFNGNQMPDQVAHEAFEAGMLPEDSVDVLWQTIHTELASVETWRQRVRKAEDSLRSARYRAKVEAKAWEEQEIAKAQAAKAENADRDAKRGRVLRSNSTEWSSQVAAEATRIRTRQNKGGTVLTQFHEWVEGRFRAGQLSMSETFTAIRAFEAATRKTIMGKILRRARCARLCRTWPVPTSSPAAKTGPDRRCTQSTGYVIAIFSTSKNSD